ncbi:hypothetical protein J2Y45_000948 [Dyadobacter sp. BE34]|uniref:Uncharacterized protein n=1 Tax=Dyadobacter fermentans TaxID=94254 RepID=A0ABU1QRH3_9BACT|nr:MULTISPECIES: hypothetical protein [Dyadobacter]MDR6803678.1 hypothetical protein [Dyadobacter fermentans]MDR7041418.1 hypothetical protein [Dyadobacter sp. BE242]MDR7195822.1 hypothetical protein [Dyadobacter sp. BE34]MDR7213634.1 hypothetical protein [Dyadobacter sp. BE31]MDR7261228.1 hypothetical protein [Dyadobacter sp. BE32]
MNNSSVKIGKKRKRPSSSRPDSIIGEYATIEEAIEAKKAKLLEVIPELDLSVLLQRIAQ